MASRSDGPRGFELERAEAERLRALGYAVHVAAPSRARYRVAGRWVVRSRSHDLWGWVDVAGLRRDGVYLVSCGPASRAAAKRAEVDLHAAEIPRTGAIVEVVVAGGRRWRLMGDPIERRWEETT